MGRFLSYCVLCGIVFISLDLWMGWLGCSVVGIGGISWGLCVDSLLIGVLVFIVGN